MSKYTALNPALYDYMLRFGTRESEVLKRLREETDKMEMSEMQISPQQGQFMHLLVKLTAAKRILEIGTYTGYSSLVMALALPDDGHITCCDLSEKWTFIARRYWRDAGVQNKIDLRLAPAAETLSELVDQYRENTFDLAFIDADKENYMLYYEHCLRLIRRGGLILIDNVLWDGKVLDSETDDPDTRAIHALNEKLVADDRIELAMVPVADGLSLCLKR